MNSKKHAKVFLDANIVIRAGKPPGGQMLERLKYLVNVGLITVLTTDLTCQEVAKKHAENDYKIIKDIGRGHFRRVVKEVLGTELPEITKIQLKAKLAKLYEHKTKDMFRELGCKTLTIDGVKPSIVFSSYVTNKGFFTQEGKKNQFPDAFIFECLKAKASKKEPIIIVSNDHDFEKPVEGEPNISLVESLPKLFEELGLKDEAPDIDINDFLERNEHELLEAVTYELECWGLVGDVPGSKINRTIVTGVRAVELESFGPTGKGGPILVVGCLRVNTEISYTHPDWEKGMYYSEYEDFSHGNVNGETEVEFEVDMSMSLAVDKDDNPKNIEEVNFLSNNFQYIELYSYGFYKWWRKKDLWSP